MSIERRETFTCPRCGQVNEFTVWQTLNGDIDPEAKRQLLDGTLFHVRCGHCGYEAEMIYPLLYHDMRHRTMVYLVAEDDVERTREELAQAQRLIELKIGIQVPPRRYRIVTRANDLREKAIIFENDLDDRVVEIIKAIYLSNALKQHPDIERVYFMVDAEKYILEAFGDNLYHMEIRRDIYAGIRDVLAGQLEAAGDDECVIDLNWAMEFLKA